MDENTPYFLGITLTKSSYWFSILYWGQYTWTFHWNNNVKQHLTSQSLVWRWVRTARTILWLSAGSTHISEFFRADKFFNVLLHRKINIGSITHASSVFLTERERERGGGERGRVRSSRGNNYRSGGKKI